MAILILDTAMWHVLDIVMLEELTMQESEKTLTQFHLPFIPQSPPGKHAGASLLETERQAGQSQFTQVVLAKSQPAPRHMSQLGQDQRSDLASHPRCVSTKCLLLYATVVS